MSGFCLNCHPERPHAHHSPLSHSPPRPACNSYHRLRLGCPTHAASGDVDTSFGSGLTIDQTPTTIATQPDRKVVLAGKSFLVSGRIRHGLFRLNEDGTPDITFEPETYPGAEVSSLAVQSDGKILAAGILSTSASETPRATVTRYFPDGRLDTTFQAPVLRGLWESGNTRHVSILLCPDKKILVSEVEQYSSFSRAYLRRLNANGTFDTSFDRDYFFDGAPSSPSPFNQMARSSSQAASSHFMPDPPMGPAQHQPTQR